MDIILKSLPDYLPEEVKNHIVFYALTCSHQLKPSKWITSYCGGDILEGRLDMLHFVGVLPQSLATKLREYKDEEEEELWEMLQANHIGKIPNKSKIKTKKHLIQALMAI